MPSSLDFPDDLILEIFANLPTKSAAKFSTVSKKWRDSTADGYFRDLHSDKSPVPSSHVPLFLLSQGIDGHRSAITFCLREGDESGNNDPTVYRHIIPFRAVNTNGWDGPDGRDFRFASTCNGLVCLKPEDRTKPAVVCNPLTLECLVLPPCAGGGMCHVLGLGYGTATKEYKAVCVSDKIFVLTLGADTTWREAADVEFSYGKSPVYVDGTIYWLVRGHYGTEFDVLVFDVESERARLVENILPFANSSNADNLQLMEVHGRVSLIYQDKSYVEIWRPIDGNLRCWEQRHKIPISTPLKERNYDLPWVVSIWDRSEFLHILVQDCTMVYAEDSFSKWTEFEGPDIVREGLDWQLCINFKPSLVSLRRYGCITGERRAVSNYGVKAPPAILLPPAARPVIRLENDDESLVSMEDEQKYHTEKSNIVRRVTIILGLCLGIGTFVIRKLHL